RGPLPLRQVRHIAKQHLQPLAALGALVDARAGVSEPRLELLDRALPAPQFNRLVVGDSVEPRLQLDVAALTGQRSHHLQHRVLDRVLSVLRVAEDADAEAVEVPLVAAEDRGEGVSVAATGALRQALVRGQPVQARARTSLAPPRPSSLPIRRRPCLPPPGGRRLLWGHRAWTPSTAPPRSGM